MAQSATFVREDRTPGVPSRFVFEVSAACTARELLGGLGLSRPTIGRVFARGQLSFDAAEPASVRATPLVPTSRLEAGQLVALQTHVTREDAPSHEGGSGRVPASAPVHVLYEDPFVIAVEKPAGLLVHGDGTGAATLTDRVCAHMARAGNPAVPQAVQRLDVETTGAVLFSKTEEFQGLFDALVADGGVEKRYLAVVAGTYPRERDVLTGPIARDRHDARRMRVARAGQGGQPALTEVERLAVAPDGRHTIVGVRLGTGRKHQIRVHLADQGFPVVNDPLYGSVETPSGLMLHAWMERFVHPVTGAPVAVRADWPERFSAWFSAETVDDWPAGRKGVGMRETRSNDGAAR